MAPTWSFQRPYSDPDRRDLAVYQLPPRATFLSFASSRSVCFQLGLQILILLARQQADFLEGREMLGRLGRVVDDEIGFADVFVRATMPRIELERAPVVLEGEVHLAGLAVRVAKIVLAVCVPRIAERGGGERPDRGLPVLRL